MNRLIIASAAVLFGTAAYAQSAVNAFRFSQPDLKGTARYMSMGGAFGALGGDLSTLSHNPAGIGVYRNNEVGFTLDLDLQHSESDSDGIKNGVNQTKFLLNNIGFVWTMRLPSSTCPNINFGFTYNKTASFNRRYRGDINLSNSLSNYIAAVTTQGGYTWEQLTGSDYNGNNPYNPTEGYGAPWLSVLGYECGIFVEDPSSYSSNPIYLGEWGPNTKGIGRFDVRESGGVDSYNIALGGNIANVVYWGMDFDITHLNYNLNPEWTENLQNARVLDGNTMQFVELPDMWKLSNYYNCSGTGFNYKLGFIVKPIQEFRVGFAFETPTWYTFNETFGGQLYNYMYPSLNDFNQVNDGEPAFNNVNFRTPWKLNVSAAAVLLNRLIVSAEYEWTQYKGMKYSAPSPYGGYYPWDDPWDDPWYDPFYPYGSGNDPYISSSVYNEVNHNVRTYYKNTNTLRLGAEFRLTPQFSVRAGYSFVSSPVREEAKEGRIMIDTAGTIPNYRFDETTNYITCGLGYKIQKFYVDLAYVYKHMNSTYHAFSPWWNKTTINYPDPYIPSQTSSLSLNNSQIVLSAGFKF